jgi:hypothetical protein
MDIKEVEKLSLDEAKKVALEKIDSLPNRTINQKLRNNRLREDINSYTSMTQVIGTLYRLQLANEGMHVTGSKWQEKYKKGVH